MSCPICHKSPHDIHCPYSPDPVVHGYCKKCYTALRDDYTYWIDNDDNRFCSESCAEAYHEIKEKEWEDNIE